MSFGQAIKSGFKNLTNFQGRATRSEFWWFYLFIFLVSIPLIFVAMIPMFAALGTLDWTSTDSELTDDQAAAIFGGVLVTYALAFLFGLITFFLLLAVWVRRLHDAGYSGHWLWLSLAGLSIVPLIFAILDTQLGDNRWGPNPKGQAWPQAQPPVYAQPPVAPPTYAQPPVAPPAQPTAPPAQTSQTPPAPASGEPTDPFAAPPR